MPYKQDLYRRLDEPFIENDLDVHPSVLSGIVTKAIQKAGITLVNRGQRGEYIKHNDIHLLFDELKKIEPGRRSTLTRNRLIWENSLKNAELFFLGMLEE